MTTLLWRCRLLSDPASAYTQKHQLACPMLYLSWRHLLPQRRRVLLPQCLKSDSKQCRTKQDCTIHDNSMNIRGAFQTPWKRTVEAWWTDTGNANIMWCEPRARGHSRHFFWNISRHTEKKVFVLLSNQIQVTGHYWTSISNKNTENWSVWPQFSTLFFICVSSKVYMTAKKKPIVAF